MSTHPQGWYIAAPFLVGMALIGIGFAAAYVLQAFYGPQEIEEERGAAGLLLVLTFASFLLAFIALAIGVYVLIVHWAT